MTSLISYDYISTPIHRANPSVKLLCLFFLTLSCILAKNLIVFLVLTLFLIILSAVSKIGRKRIIKSVSPFLFIILINSLFIARFTKTDSYDVLGVFSSLGLLKAGVMLFRILYCLILVQLFAFTTSSGEIRSGVYNIFRFVPFVNENLISESIMIFFRLYEVACNAYNETRIASESRYSMGRKYSLKRIKVETLSFFIRMCKFADNMSESLTSRLAGCRTIQKKGQIKLPDILILMSTILIFAFVIYNKFFASRLG